jgi:hypothetical protein
MTVRYTFKQVDKFEAESYLPFKTPKKFSIPKKTLDKLTQQATLNMKKTKWNKTYMTTGVVFEGKKNS